MNVDAAVKSSRLKVSALPDGGAVSLAIPTGD
jgi:hypothetical protein